MLKSVARRVLRDEIEELEQDAFVRGIDSGFEVGSAETQIAVDNARNQAYEEGLSRGQEGNAYSYAQGYQQGYDDQSGAYNEGWEAGFQSGDGESYVKGYDEGFEAGKSESYVPEDEAVSLEDYCESLVEESFSQYDLGLAAGYDAGHEAAKQKDKDIFDDAYKLGVNDVAVAIRRVLGAHTFASLTWLLERSARG